MPEFDRPGIVLNPASCFAEGLGDISAEDATENAFSQNAIAALQENNFTSAFQHAAIGMALVSTDGQFAEVNHALCELTGYSEAELKCLKFQDITYAADLDANLAYFYQLSQGEISSYRMEKRYFHKQGHLIWVLISVSLVRDLAGKPRHFISQIQDITERKHFEAELLTSQRELSTLVENVPDIITRFDRNLKVLYINASIETITTRPSSHFMGLTLEEAKAPADVCEIHRVAMKSVLATLRPACVEYELNALRGTFYFQMRMIPEFDSDGHISTFLTVAHDITRLREAQSLLLSVQKQLEATNEILARKNEELEILALYDGLTGVKNRRALDLRLREEIAQARRQGFPFCLVLLDIDHFKNFNDSYGHGHGDQALQKVAFILESMLRPSDVVARYGGEEFALIFTHTPLESGLLAAERCRAAIAKFPWSHGAVTVSLGLVNWANQDSQTLLVQADMALYQAKQAGRNCVRLFNL